MGLVGTNSQGIATSVLAEWVKKVSDIPMPEPDKAKLDDYIDDLYNKVGECKCFKAFIIIKLILFVLNFVFQLRTLIQKIFKFLIILLKTISCFINTNSDIKLKWEQVKFESTSQIVVNFCVL